MNSSDLREKFDKQGYLVVEGFASKEECEGMMSRMNTLIGKWDPKEASVFRTDGGQEGAQGSTAYFWDSADKIHFFTEQHAVDATTGEIKAGITKHQALNKVGHGLHVADEIFKAYSESEKVSELTRTLGWKDPVLPQSMYIFKQAKIGDVVTSHQDSTFLYTTPKQTCLGLWLALEDATIDNGCLWARPGSHLEPVRRQFIRNPEYWKSKGYYDDDNTGRVGDDDVVGTGRDDDKDKDKDKDKSANPNPNSNTNTQKNNEAGSIRRSDASKSASVSVSENYTNTGGVGGSSAEPQTKKLKTTKDEKEEPPMIIFKDLVEKDEMKEWEGKLPGIDSPKEVGFVPVPVKQGDLFVIHGQLDHMSLANTSGKSRHTFQLHLVEGPSCGITWSKENWLQYKDGVKFPSLHPQKK